MPLTDSPLNDLTFRIIGCAMDVHNALGPGLKEEVYEKALAVSLQNAGLSVQRQKPMEIYLDQECVGVVILDLLVQELVVVEVKAFPHLTTDDEVGQVITYLTASGLDVGLLINFGRRSLDFHRVFPPSKVQSHRDRVARRVVGGKGGRPTDDR